MAPYRQIALKASAVVGPARGQKVVLYQGDDADFNFTGDGTLGDLTGKTIIFTTRSGGAAVEIQHTATLISGPAETFRVRLASAESLSLPPGGSHFWGVQVEQYGAVTTIADGSVLLYASVGPALTSPAFTSANAIAFTPGTAGTFTVTVAGIPASPALSVTGTLPTGVTFTDNGNGTGTLAGTPAAGTDIASPYPLTFTANNGVGTTTQPFTLTINPLPLGSAIFASVLSQYLSRTNPALLSPGSSPFSFACWAKLTTTITTSENLAGKWNPTGNQREWLVGFETIGFRFRISANGTTSLIDFTNANVTPVVGTWYRLLFTWDGTTATIYVNGGNAATSVNAGTVFQGTADFVLGANSQPGTFFTGEQARAAFWSRALSAGDAVTDYNGGHSFRYATLPAGLLAGNVAWWDETEAVGTTRLDSSANGLNLTDHNNVNLDPAGPP